MNAFIPSKKQSLFIGLGLVAIGLIANEWVLTAFLSADGILSPRSVVVIWLFEAVMVFTGLVLAISRSVGKVLEFWIGIALTIALIWGAEKVFYRRTGTVAAVSARYLHRRLLHR